jgi:hypothetical protein
MSLATSTAASRPSGGHRGALFLLSAVIITLLGLSAILFQMVHRAAVRGPELDARERAQNLHAARILAAIDEIEDSLGVVMPEGRSPRLRSSSASERMIGHSNADALERIAEIRATLLNRQQRIGELESSLDQTQRQFAGAQQSNARLESTLKLKEARVAQLARRVRALDARATGLESDVADAENTIRRRDETIEDKRRQIGTVYYVIGDKKRLSEAGVIESRGGILGLGKVLQVSSGLDDDSFKRLYTDKRRTIRVPATRARVLSAQPASSYSLAQSGEQMVLRIVDPERFRAIKHVVILTE